jgi:hypothetical protein
MEIPLTGGCQCGKLRYEITEAPRLVYSCHCTKCQKITSSAFSMGFVVTEEAFRLTAGEQHLAQSTGDSGCLLVDVPRLRLVAHRRSRLGGMLRSVRAGTLTTPHG